MLSNLRFDLLYFLAFFRCNRGQLRRAVCQEVHPYTPGSNARLLLLQRERTSLVPRAAMAAEKERCVTHGEGTGVSVPCFEAKGFDGAERVCPKEGDDSERFSRLVRARPRCESLAQRPIAMNQNIFNSGKKTRELISPQVRRRWLGDMKQEFFVSGEERIFSKLLFIKIIQK